MSKLEKEFQNESKMRILRLENELEEFKNNVTEKNLRLKEPYAKDKNGNGLTFSVPDAESKIMYVYLGNKLVGQVTIEEEL